MPRPAKNRTVRFTAGVTRYIPVRPSSEPLETAPLALDQLEALRLADMMDFSHEEAARQMKVSRATFGRILASARRTVAEALVYGKTVSIGGGPCTFTERQLFYCPSCRHEHAAARRSSFRCRCCETPPLNKEA